MRPKESFCRRRRLFNNKKTYRSITEEMVAEFKTVFQVAREDGHAAGRDETPCFAIKGLVSKTRLSDKVIAFTLNVSAELVRTIREEVKAEKLATAKKAAKAATPKKETKAKTQKP